MIGHVACRIILVANKRATANNWCCDLKLGKSCASNITQASDVRSSTIIYKTILALKTIDQGIVKMNQNKPGIHFSEAALNTLNHWGCFIAHLALKRWGSLLAFKAQLKCSVVPSHWLAEEPRWRINHASNFTAGLPACLPHSRWTLHHLGQITLLEIIHHFRGKVLKVCPQHEHRIPQPMVEMQ